MKKQVLYSIVVLLIGLFLMVPLATAKMTIKVAHVDRGDRHQSDMEAFAATFKDLVESQSGGEMEVKIYPAGQLGSMRELVESTQLGAIQVVCSYSAVAAIFSPKAELMAAPFLFASAPEAWHVQDGPFGRELAQAILKDSKLRVLAYGEANGFRDLFTTKKPIHKPADLKEMKIRSTESKMMFNMLADWGAKPVVVPWTGLYTAMQTGVADGWEVQPNGVVDQKLYETAKYITLTDHIYDTLYIFANDQWFNKLTPRQKEIVANAARVGAVASRGVTEDNNGDSLRMMQSKGLKIYSPTQEELAEFAKLCRAASLSYLEKNAGKEWVQKLLRARDEARKALAVK